jgi:imidazole glycerol phosphate synthase glutamine amidotransferase subunit
LNSVYEAFNSQISSGDKIQVLSSIRQEKTPNLVVLPGLGNFSAGMRSMENQNLIKTVKNWHDESVKIVGLCLGMQLLGTESEESPGVRGLNLIPSRIKRLPEEVNERIPNIGWASAELVNTKSTFKKQHFAGDFYFVHSYHMKPVDSKVVLTKTSFGRYKFASSVLSENTLGLQFHPEKSGKIGSILIEEVINWARNEN